MAGTSEARDVKSPQEIEEEIKSKPTVTWDPFIVLPKEIYLMIFNKLERAEDKRNFMNAHVKLYNLFKSSRTSFLAQLVIKEVISRDFEYMDSKHYNPDNDDYDKIDYENYHHCRLVCHDWDKGVQDYFQFHSYYFRIDDHKEVNTHRAYLKIFRSGTDGLPCKNFSWLIPGLAKRDLEMFSVTHPPSKNPFFSRAVTLMPFSRNIRPLLLTEEWLRRYRRAVDALLERYGQHIWHCKMEIGNKLDVEACLQIVKWLRLMPELKTLRMHCFGAAHQPFSEMGRKELQAMWVHQPEMKSLVLLESSYFPSLIFNKLFGSHKGLEKIQIENFKKDESLRDLLWGLGNIKENLKEAFLTLKGYEDFEYLQDTRAFPSLRKLVTKVEFEPYEEDGNQAYSTRPDWSMIFEILEVKFPALEELSLTLPKATSDWDHKSIIDQSLECRMYLPKLKKMWVALPNLCSLDFLLPCKALEKLEIVLEHSEWDSEASEDLRKRENINLNMDLKKLWESIIWEVLPKLWKLNVVAFREECEPVKIECECEYVNWIEYNYEKVGKNKMYSVYKHYYTY